MRISETLGLKVTQSELDFVDIDTNEDTNLFLDPYFISKCDFPLANAMYMTIKNYFEYVLELLKDNNVSEAKEVFSYLGEPSETCLGMAKGNINGSGIGPINSDNIINSLLTSKALKSSLITDIEDCKIFIKGVDRDRMSDMITNIIRKHLNDYTIQQCNFWNIKLDNMDNNNYYWEPQTRSWEYLDDQGLIINGKRILLVPKRLVSYTSKYTQHIYYNQFALEYKRNEHLRFQTELVRYRKPKKGEAIGQPYLYKKTVDEYIRKTEIVDKAWLDNFTASHSDVFQNFKSNRKNLKNVSPVDVNVNSTEEPIEISNYLINKLKKIKTGNIEASIYHHLTAVILEYLFYPSISCPVIEKEIHDGRKRIDIVFNNTSNFGFFKNLVEIKQIPSAHIIVECKNYTNEVGNPELDQISGRLNLYNKFGIITFRNFENNKKFIKSCNDTCKDGRGFIIPLSDEDLIELLKLRGENKFEEIDNYLEDRLRDIML